MECLPSAYASLRRDWVQDASAFGLHGVGGGGDNLRHHAFDLLCNQAKLVLFLPDLILIELKPTGRSFMTVSRP